MFTKEERLFIWKRKVREWGLYMRHVEKYSI